MQFNIKDRKYPQPKGYTEDDIADAKIVCEKLVSKLKFIKAGVLSRIAVDSKILPLYIYIDDLTHTIKQKEIEEYVHTARSLIKKHNPNIQLHPVRLSEHWEKFTQKDQQYLNTLRYGIVLYDQGFVQPVMTLLKEGKIRPSKEAIGVYYSRTGITMKNSVRHMLQATIDLYWAAMDASHAAIMATGKMPPAPADMPEALELTFVSRKLLEPAYPKVIQHLYNLHKSIERKEIVSMTGAEFENNLKKTKDFVNRMEKLIRKVSP